MTYLRLLPLGRSIKQYADDTTVSVMADSTQELKQGLESVLNNITEWVAGNGLHINEDKMQLMFLSKRRREKELHNVDIHVGNHNLKVCHSVKCLGVTIDNRLKCTEHISTLRQKCSGVLAGLKKLTNVLPLNLKLQLYKSLILPHLDYCSVVWQECTQQLQQKLECVQNSCLCFVLNMPPRMSWRKCGKTKNVQPIAEKTQQQTLHGTPLCIDTMPRKTDTLVHIEQRC